MRAQGVEVVEWIAGILIVLFVLASLYSETRLADRVLHEGEIRPLPATHVDASVTRAYKFIRDELQANPLRIEVVRVKVWPATAGGQLPSSISAGTTLSYLGRNSDTILLYNTDTKQTLRVPAARLVLTEDD